MTEKKRSARRPKAQADAEVSTGAWWKSARARDREEAASAAQAQTAADAAAPPEGDGDRPQDGGQTGTRPASGRRSRRGRRRKKAEPPLAATGGETAAKPDAPEEAAAASPEARPDEAPAAPAKKSGRGRRRGKKAEPASGVADNATDAVADAPVGDAEPGAAERSAPEDGGPGAEPGFQRDPKAVYRLLINAEEPEECRVALLENGRLESFHVSTVERAAIKNNIYKGRIISVEASLQVAFVDIGTGRNAFLPFNEIHPEYYREDLEERVRDLVEEQEWRKIKIEEVMRKGQEVLVQVVKEAIGSKGASVTTYLSLPGRCLVLLPGSDSAGISRKIQGEGRRAELREIMGELDLPEGIGYIVRTAGADIGRVELKDDLDRLLALWEQIRGRGQSSRTPALVYQEQDTVASFLRDHFFPEIQEIVVDTQETLQVVRDFVDHLPKAQRKVLVRQHKGVRPIFNQQGIEEQIESIFRPRVALPSGGSIVIDPTEALVAIDVNSGRTSKNDDFEETIFQANLEAADELTRQLRLRDLGGLIVVDFIDMRKKEHIQEVERRVRAGMRRDKARVDIGRISHLGLMQISRQKMGAPIAKGSYITCPHCQGRGVVRSVETQALVYLRRIQTGIIRKKVGRVVCRFPQDVALYLLNRKKEELANLERQHSAAIEIGIRPDGRPSDRDIEFLAAENGN